MKPLNPWMYLNNLKLIFRMKYVLFAETAVI